MTNTMIETKTITINKDGGWKHADGRFLMIGDTESIALVYAVKGAGPKGDAEYMDDMLVAIFAVMHERAQR